MSAGHFLSARRQRQNSTAAPVAGQRESARGHRVGLGICGRWERTRTVFLGSQCSHSDFIPEGMAYGRGKSGSIVLAVTRPGCVPGVSSPQASKVGVPCCQGTQCGWFRLIQDLDTSLVVFLRGICSGLGPPEGGIVYGLFSKEALYVGKASVSRTHSPGLVARLTEHVTQEALANSVPLQASSVSRCALGGHSFFSSLHSTDTGRACVLWFSRSSLSV